MRYFNLWVVSLIVLIAVGSLSLFSNPNPVIDFSTSTNVQESIVIPAGKEVFSAVFDITPLSTTTESNIIGYNSGYYYSSYTYTKYYANVFTSAVDGYISYVYSPTYPVYLYMWDPSMSQNVQVCQIDSLVVPERLCPVKSNTKYYLISSYYGNNDIYQSTSYIIDTNYILSSDYGSRVCDNLYCDNVETSSYTIYSNTRYFYNMPKYFKIVKEDKPSDLSILIDRNSIYSSTGTLSTTDTTRDFADILNSYCNRPSNKAECTVPITFSVSQAGGKIQVNDTIVLKDIHEENSLSSTTESKFYQYRAFSKTTKIRDIRESFAERIKKIISTFMNPSELTTPYYTTDKVSSQLRNEEPPICKIIRILRVCDQ